MRPTAPKRHLLYTVFVCALWLPLLAALLSPQIGRFAPEVLRDPRAFDAELNRLREKTPLWNGAVAIYNRALYAAGTSGRPGAAEVGRSGWVFLGDLFNRNFSQAIGRRVLDDDEVQRWLETLDLQGRWLAARHIPSAVIVAPAKWSIYPDRLPWWTQALPAPIHSFDRLLAAAHSRPLIDLRPTLREARNHVDTYSALNSHWTDYGGWIAWRQIAAELPQRIGGLPALAVPAIGSVGVVDDDNEFAGMLNLAAANAWTTYKLREPLPDEIVELADGKNVALAGGTRTDLLELPRTVRNDHADNALRVLVLRDSSGNALSPFLQNAFRVTWQVDHHIGVPGTWPNLPGMVEQFHPDLVLWVMTERYLDAPLGDLDFWRNAHAYECAAARDDAWPGHEASRKFAVTAAAPPAQVQLTLPPASAMRVLRVGLRADSQGLLAVSVAGSARNYFYGAGRNELFIRLDATAQALPVRLIGAAGSGASIDALEVRSIDDACPADSSAP